MVTGENIDAGALALNVTTGLVLNYKWGDNGLNYNNRLNQVVDYADDVITRGNKEGANQYRKNAAQSARNYRNNYLTNKFSGLAFGSIRDESISNGVSQTYDVVANWIRKMFSR